MEVVDAEAAGAQGEAAGARARSPERGSRTPFWSKWVGGLRPRVAIGLASLALLAGVAIGLVAAGGGDGGGSETVAATVDRARLPGATAQVEVADADGRPATLRVSGVPLPPAGRVYEVWVERDGEVRPAGALFEPGRDGRGSAAIPGGVEGVDRVMVTRERRGGAARPTEMPVVVAEL
jgi:hypothetical protein